MITTSTETVLQFISHYNLKRKNGLILFDATVDFHPGKELHSINSEVLVIELPNKIAVYVLEFLKGDFNEPEMYCTNKHQFKYTATGQLEISDLQNAAAVLISIIPV